MLKLIVKKPLSLSSTLVRSFRTKNDVYNGINPLSSSAKPGHVISEFSHITSLEEKSWLEENLEKALNTPLTLAQKMNSLRFIQMQDSFDVFLNKKFSFYKRFSGEGLEALVPSLYSISQEFHSPVPSSLILSLPHRGKLGIIVSLFNYPLRNMFWKIKGYSIMPEDLNKDMYYFSDDLHFGTTVERPELKNLKLTNTHNSAHLEIRGAVGMGKTRSKIDRNHRAMHVWVHGDGALAAQGVVYELTQMTHLENFSVGGTIQIVANNQIGYTATEEECRSTPYCTDIYKIIEAPIVHVNALDIDEVVKLSQLAVNYRNRFKNDFVLDIVGYRKFGHNELEDPTFTNPLMYKKIRSLKSTAQIYAEKLINEGSIKQDFYDKLVSTFEQHLNSEFEIQKKDELRHDNYGRIKITQYNDQWNSINLTHNKTKLQTGYNKQKLQEIVQLSADIPSTIKAHPILIRNMHARLDNLAKNKIDWATAETLAFGSLLQQGYNVRLCGEDSVRGTFSQRNIGFYCQDTEKMYIPLHHITPGKLFIINSILSELAVVGFEYGYSLDHPENLVLWEAQFGDFANMAQPFIDTYIANGESKWMRQSGLVMLLPHGQEGQGPDHSSAMLERYLGLVNDPLANQLNLEVCNLVIPSNYFHLLRNAMMRNFRRPIVIGTPKSGLRNKFAFSSIEDFDESSSFKPVVISDQGRGSKKLIACSGKVYLDLKAQFSDISILLIEQLSPLPYEEIEKAVKDCQKEVVWVQEEHVNFGVYKYLRTHLEKICGKVKVVAKPPLSCSAVGNSVDFKIQQEDLFKRVAEIINS